MRHFIPTSITIVLLAACTSHEQIETLPPWEPGMLDIHCISTGVGNATFTIMPDGTTMLTDAGELNNGKKHRAPRLPDASKGGGAWIADYIQMFHPQGKEATLDYAFITHFHDDHIGGMTPETRMHPQGGYGLSGITELGSIIPISCLYDRGYTFPVDMDTCSLQGVVKLRDEIAFYRSFVDYQTSQGMKHEIIRVGSRSQLGMLHDPEAYPDFGSRVLFCSGKVAFAEGEALDTDEEAYASAAFAEGEYPGENDLSAGYRIDYGPFRFYSGGDIAGIGHTGEMDPNSMECRVADIVGPVDVAILNHHGDRNSQNEKFVATVCPRVWIGFGWGVRHPGQEVARRISSKFIYPGERDVYQTWISPHCEAYLGNTLNAYKSTSGHVVVRVAPGGRSYDIYVLDDSNAKRGIIMHNQYETKGQ